MMRHLSIECSCRYALVWLFTHTLCRSCQIYSSIHKYDNFRYVHTQNYDYYQILCRVPSYGMRIVKFRFITVRLFDRNPIWWLDIWDKIRSKSLYLCKINQNLQIKYVGSKEAIIYIKSNLSYSNRNTLFARISEEYLFKDTLFWLVNLK